MVLSTAAASSLDQESTQAHFQEHGLQTKMNGKRKTISDFFHRAGQTYRICRVCVIYVDTRRLNDVSKVWIEIDNPVTGKEMWWDEDQIKTFIKAFPWKWNPERSLRMAWIDGIKDLLQLLIPPELVAASGSLGLSAVCKEKISDLPDRATVNYDDWQNNIGGQRGPQRY